MRPGMAVVALLAGAVAAARADEAAHEPVDAAGWVRLAAHHTGQGRRADADGAWARVCDLVPDHAAARRALGFVRAAAGWELELTAQARKGLVPWGDHWIFPVEAAWRRRRGETPPLRTGTVDRLTAAMAAAPSAEVRAACCRRLAECPASAAMVPLRRAAVTDADAAVRVAAFAALQGLGPDVAAVALHAALHEGPPEARLRAATAIGRVADSPLAPRLALGHWIGVLTRGPRVNLFVGSEIAYLRDFEVEVA